MKILIVRLGALGDVVHAIPVAAALRRAFPDSRIDWLVSAKHREILDLVPIINRRLAIIDRPSAAPRQDENSERDAIGNEQSGSAGTHFWTAIQELRRTRYDVVIDLQGLIKSAVIARGSGAPRVIGFVGRYLREPLARMLYTEIHDPEGDGLYAPTETRHVIEINLGVLQNLGIATTAPEFPIEQTDSPLARHMRDRTGGRYVLINPGAAWPNKRWPPSRFGRVAASIREHHGLPSVVLWGPDEREIGEDVVTGSGGAAILSPRTTIADIVALARGAAVMISGDTGPTHIAAAVGTPLVGIYGPTRPERNGPFRPGDETVSRASLCQCHHLRRCKLDKMCLLDIAVDDVIDAVDRRLAVSTGGRRAEAGI